MEGCCTLSGVLNQLAALNIGEIYCVIVIKLQPNTHAVDNSRLGYTLDLTFDKVCFKLLFSQLLSSFIMYFAISEMYAYSMTLNV